MYSWRCLVGVLKKICMYSLFQDILTLSASMNGECLAASSVKQMKLVSEEFFTKMGLFAISYGSKDLEEASKAFDDAVTFNHLR